MPKFTANIDKKYTIWQNITIEFEAKDQDEAMEKLKSGDGIASNAEFITCENIIETEEAITEEENGGQAVWELKSLE